MCLNHSVGADMDIIKRLVPPLSYNARKGQMGRIGILGGSADFTGAPFYAGTSKERGERRPSAPIPPTPPHLPPPPQQKGMSSLKVGGDLCYVFTAEEAAGPIKGYSPELMVTPVYSATSLGIGSSSSSSKATTATTPKAKEEVVRHMVHQVTSFFPKLHVLVVGPGLGRDPFVLEATKRILLEAKKKALPLVIDADGLWLVAQEPNVLHDYPGDGGGVVLTPNLMEFARLQAGLTGASVAEAVPSRLPPQYAQVMAMAKDLGGATGRVTVCLKGREDIVADKERWLVVTEEGAQRRSGGLGDILAGTMGVLVHWSRLALQAQETTGKACEASASTTTQLEETESVLWACAAAATIARRASREAFQEKRRSMTAPDAIGTSFFILGGGGGSESFNHSVQFTHVLFITCLYHTAHLGPVLEAISPTNPGY